MTLEFLHTLFKLLSPESRGPEVYGDGHERQVAGRLGAVGACICPEERQVRHYVQIGAGPPHAAVVLTLSATDVKRSTEPDNSAVLLGTIRTAQVPAAKAWLDEVVGSLAVLAGAVEGLVSGGGGGVWLDEGVGSLAVLAGAVEGLVSGGGGGVWLDEGVGSLAVLAGAVKGLVSGGGGSLAG